MLFSDVDADEEDSAVRNYSALMRDGLTGLFNRRHFDACLERDVRNARIFQQPLSLAMIDLDHFKRINDNWGHAAGDQVLRHCAMTLNASMRSTDLIARLGGEEFAILLRNTALRDAQRVLSRFTRSFGVRPVCFHGHALPITASAGVSAIEEDPDLDAAGLMHLADERLYEAKRCGRNRVVAA